MRKFIFPAALSCMMAVSGLAMAQVSNATSTANGTSDKAAAGSPASGGGVQSSTTGTMQADPTMSASGTNTSNGKGDTSNLPAGATNGVNTQNTK
jgi:hypothetical protein